jgi:hypothetical protein
VTVRSLLPISVARRTRRRLSATSLPLLACVSLHQEVKSSGTTILICGSLFGQSLLSSRATTQLSRTTLCWRTPPTIQMRYLLRRRTTSSRRCHPRQWTSSKIRKQPAVGTTPPIRYQVVPTASSLTVRDTISTGRGQTAEASDLHAVVADLARLLATLSTEIRQS